MWTNIGYSQIFRLTFHWKKPDNLMFSTNLSYLKSQTDTHPERIRRWSAYQRRSWYKPLEAVLSSSSRLVFLGFNINSPWPLNRLNPPPVFETHFTSFYILWPSGNSSLTPWTRVLWTINVKLGLLRGLATEEGQARDESLWTEPWTGVATWHCHTEPIDITQPRQATVSTHNTHNNTK